MGCSLCKCDTRSHTVVYIFLSLIVIGMEIVMRSEDGRTQ